MNEYKSLKKLNISNNKDDKLKKYIISKINKILITIIFFLLILIGTKVSQKFKTFFYQNAYVTNFKFAEVNAIYQKYLGDILPFKFKETTETVFNEELNYKSSIKYLDGCSLEVENNYLVPTIESGIIVFIGEKEGYGKTVIIQQINGIDTWYSNINVVDVSIYDYIAKGSLIGEAIDKKLYLVFQKNGEFLAYQNYI